VPKGETPSEWESRNRVQFLKSTKDALGREMWFAVKINVIGTFSFAVGLFIGLTYYVNWAMGLMGSTFLIFGVSLYWAWYIRRGENRKWEKQLAANAFTSGQKRTEIVRPPENLGRVSGTIDEDGPAPTKAIGPQRSWPT
jgi:hypothetical protein